MRLLRNVLSGCVLRVRDRQKSPLREAQWATFSESLIDYADATAARFIRRDLRRFAAFLWMTPRFAARSTMETVRLIAEVIASASPATIADWVFLIAVLMRLLVALLRKRRARERRTSFTTDFIFGTVVYSFRKVSTSLYTISHYRWHGRLNHGGVKPTGSCQRNNNLALVRHALFNARNRRIIEIH